MNKGVFWREAGTIVVVVLLLVFAMASQVGYSKARVALESRSSSYARISFQDRIIGSAVDLRRLGGITNLGPAAGRPALIWVIDLDSCHSCFDTVTWWMELEQRLADHDLVLLLAGEATSPGIQARIRILGRTKVVEVHRDSVVEEVGATLASTKILLDDSGVVLLADSRSSGQECGWSFEAQVGVLRGLPVADLIRSTPPAATAPGTR